MAEFSKGILEALDIYHVPDDAPVEYEHMGTKDKFWFVRDRAKWLFKITRPGEHWSEILAACLAEKLGLPHAHYELAHWEDHRGDHIGVITRCFVNDAFELIHGNELLVERDPTYPREGERHVRTREHTIDAVTKVVADEGVELPVDWNSPLGITFAGEVFSGYLLLDTWIGNTDRHHENWLF